VRKGFTSLQGFLNVERIANMFMDQIDKIEPNKILQRNLNVSDMKSKENSNNVRSDSSI